VAILATWELNVKEKPSENVEILIRRAGKRTLDPIPKKPYHFLNI
jgi:hypothetical protein